MTVNDVLDVLSKNVDQIWILEGNGHKHPFRNECFQKRFIIKSSHMLRVGVLIGVISLTIGYLLIIAVGKTGFFA